MPVIRGAGDRGPLVRRELAIHIDNLNDSAALGEFHRRGKRDFFKIDRIVDETGIETVIGFIKQFAFDDDVPARFAAPWQVAIAACTNGRIPVSLQFGLEEFRSELARLMAEGARWPAWEESLRRHLSIWPPPK